MAIHNYQTSDVIWPYKELEADRIAIYRILNLKEGYYLDNLYFKNKDAAQGYLSKYLAKQWEQYENILQDYSTITTWPILNTNGPSRMIGTYKGEPFGPPTDREYMFEIVEI